MKKILIADLVSIAHRVLQIKDKNHTKELLKEVRELHEKLTLLNYYEENADRLKHLQNEEDLWAEEKDHTIEVALPNYGEVSREVVDETPENNEVSTPEKKEEVDAMQKEEKEPQAPKEEVDSEVNKQQPEEKANEDTQVVEENQEEDKNLFTPSVEATTPTVEEVDERIEKIEEASPSATTLEKQFELLHEEQPAKEEPFTPTIEETQPTVEQIDQQIETIEQKDPIEDEKEAIERVKLDIDPVYYNATNDLFSQVETTPNTTTKEEKTSKTLNDAYGKTFKLDLNDRIAFSSHLFDTSTADLNRVVSQVNSFDTYEEVEHFINNYVKPEYNNWVGKEEYEQRFMEKIKKRFE